MLDVEKKVRKAGFSLIIGIDEAGRGPLAGPVVAAAVALKKHSPPFQVRDSKKLSAAQREKAFHKIYEYAHVGVGIMSEGVIDEVNILQATFLAMQMAVIQLLSGLPGSRKTKKNFEKRICLLIDGNQFQSDLPYCFKTIVKGDEQVLSIACASIIAKVTRDRILGAYHRVFPEYGFNQHKGYPTRRHKQAIRRWGLSSIHRKTFHCQL
ncbi:MAG: ribonuclease HII [Omnitrophica WOR_2 bacterium RIFCSPHIGHO2_02_FULL_50_17]|nr:MAG: ribonuclease HII [Omnitrophica WOR_2 bacterium RIFCSPHIGHO2_02_FULL_50_17]